MDDDRISAESGAGMTLVPHDPSEYEKLKHQLTHIPFQPMVHIMLKGKHKRNHTNAQSASSKTVNFQ